MTQEEKVLGTSQHGRHEPRGPAHWIITLSPRSSRSCFKPAWPSVGPALWRLNSMPSVPISPHLSLPRVTVSSHTKPQLLGLTEQCGPFLQRDPPRRSKHKDLHGVGRRSLARWGVKSDGSITSSFTTEVVASLCEPIKPALSLPCSAPNPRPSPSGTP